MSETPVNQLRVVLVTEDFDAAVGYYRDTLGLPESAAIAGPEGAQVVILEAGRATLELANPAQARFIAEVETGGTPSTPVRLAFQVPDVDAATATFAGTGARVVAPPVRTPWNSRNARLEGPAGVQVTLFQELAGQDGPAGLVGASLSGLGGERGLLARTVELARRHGAGGQLPFVAAVVHDGTVIGAGVNTSLTDHDPTAHGEIAAIRDATRRTGRADLAGAVVYSSCEPCAICRTVAAAAGVREIVFAAGKEAVPVAIDPTPDLTARLVDAVNAQLPGIARRGDAGLSTVELAAPFRAFLDATTRG